MSRIITNLVCAKCNHEWNGYISFGHPEQDIEHKWVCENCGTENTEVVPEWINSKGPQNDKVVYLSDPTSILRIFDSELNKIDPTGFNWEVFDDKDMQDDFGGYLTLGQISEQLNTVERHGCIYVWIESPLYGAIYEYGNYGDGIWRLHGKTNGYA